MWLLLASLPGLAAGLVGVDWVPFGRDDLAWVEDNQLSGTLVAEGDGLLQPSLRAWGGWTEGQNAVLGNLSGAWLSTESVTSGTTSGSRVSALRLGADYRRYLRPRAPGAPVPWLGAGADGVLTFIVQTVEGFKRVRITPGPEHGVEALLAKAKPVKR